MTGYQAIMLPLLELQNGTYIDFKDLSCCYYVIQDGPRIGYPEDACISTSSSEFTIVASCTSQICPCIEALS
jgi:hypothetical protein